MITYAYVNSDGIPTSGGSRRSLPDGAIPLPEGFDTSDLSRLIFVKDEWFERPLVQDFQETVDGIALDEGLIPVLVTIMDMETGAITETTVDAKGASLGLPENGVFEVNVSAETPWLSIERVITRGSGSSLINTAALNQMRAKSVEKINGITDKIRALISTDINGQSAIYMEKRAEAVSYLAAAEPPESLAAYPFLSAEVGVTAETAHELSQIWLNMSAMFSHIGAATEKARLMAINATWQAMSEEECRQIEDGLKQGLRAIFGG